MSAGMKRPSDSPSWMPPTSLIFTNGDKKEEDEDKGEDNKVETTIIINGADQTFGLGGGEGGTPPPSSTGVAYFILWNLLTLVIAAGGAFVVFKMGNQNYLLSMEVFIGIVMLIIIVRTILGVLW
jgi:hypothetical protein